MENKWGRILVCTVVSLLLTSFSFGVLVLIADGKFSLWALIILPVMISMNILVPALLSAFILYYLVKNKTRDVSTRTIFIISARYILISAVCVLLWALGEVLFSGDLSIGNFKRVYRRDFLGWNVFLVWNGLIIPYLYFNKKFLRVESGNHVAKTDVSEKS